MAFPAGRHRLASSMLPPRASLGAPALRAKSGMGDSTWVASGFCATSTNVVFPHFAQQNCTRGRPTSCASGRECWAPQFEQAAFIGSCGSRANLARRLPAEMRTSPNELPCGDCLFAQVGLGSTGFSLCAVLRPGKSKRHRLKPVLLDGARITLRLLAAKSAVNFHSVLVTNAYRHIWSRRRRRRHTPFCRMFKRVSKLKEPRFATGCAREAHGERRRLRVEPLRERNVRGI